MHSFWRRLGSPLLLVVMTACSGTSPSASQTSATGSTPASETTFELCGGGAAGVFSLDPASGSLRWRLCATPESTISPVAATEELAMPRTAPNGGG